MYNFIYDPISKKQFNILSNKGKKILVKYINQLGGKSKHYQEIQKILKNSKVYAPYKYFKGLTPEKTKQRLKRINLGSKTNSDDIKSYRPFATDYIKGKLIKTKKSNYTKIWNTNYPNSKSLKEKSKITGIPLSIIKIVYNKGLAAWRTGHRPGANMQQWGHARVNSFILKGKTYHTVDKYLADEAIKKSKKAKNWFQSVNLL